MAIKDDLAKHLIRGVFDSPETMNFLRQQCQEIFEEQKTIWQGKQTPEDLINKDFWGEYHVEADKKMMKYLWNWSYELVQTIRVRNEKMPHSIASAFENILDSLIEDHSEKFIEELASKLLNEIIDEEEKKNESINLQEHNVS